MRLAITALGLLACLACAGGEASRTPSRSPLPNIVLITVDTLRADHLSCYGGSYPKTPAIDFLAERGVLFEQTVTPVPLTLPAHASLMTGSLPVSHGVRDNSGFALPDSAVTLAESLSDRGYRTAGFVGAYVLDRRFGLNQGFDFYRDDFQAETVGGPTMEILERPAADVLEAAEKWIQGSPDSSPFFVWIHLFDPHAPYSPPSGFERSYAGEVAYVDDRLAGFWKFLSATGQFDSSLIVFTSDHGEGLGEHGEATHGMLLYDSTLMVPLIFKLPAGGPAARVTKPVRLIDVMPTILDLVGAPVPTSVQGVSLRGACLGGEAPDLPAVSETLLPLLNYGWSDISSYRTAKRKLIDAPTPELYDLSADPGETTNLLPGLQSMAAALKADKDSLMDRFRGNASLDAWRVPDAETVERLRSLGYASLALPSKAGKTDPVATLKASLGPDLPDPKSKIEVFNLVWEAQAKSAAGDYDGSNLVLDRLLARDSKMFMAHSIRALNWLRLKKPAKALDSLRAAVALRPEDPGAQLYLALAELELGDLPAAARGFEQTLALDPESDAARNNLATVYARQRRFDKAEALLAELSKRNPNDAAALLNLGVVRMMQSRLEPAAEAFQQALLRRPDLPEAHNNLGLVYLESGKTEAAVVEFLEAVRQRPDYVNAHANLAKAYRRLGKNGEAERHLDLARKAGSAR